MPLLVQPLEARQTEVVLEDCTVTQSDRVTFHAMLSRVDLRRVCLYNNINDPPGIQHIGRFKKKRIHHDVFDIENADKTWPKKISELVFDIENVVRYVVWDS